MTTLGRSLFRHPDFLKLWTAATVSLFGTQVSQIAIPVIAVLILNATPFEVALLGTVEFLPFLLFTLPAGVWVDRLPRRLILVTGDLGRAFMLSTIPIAYAAGVLTIWQLYLVGFINGILTVFFDVADQSYLPTILDREQLLDGNAKLQVSASSAQILGQPVGGGVVAILTAPFAVVIDAASFVGSALLIFGIRRKEAVQRSSAEGGRAAGSRTPIRTEIAEGLRYVLRHPLLRNIAACTGFSNLFSNVTFAIFAVYVYRDLGLSPAAMGTIGGVGGLGVLVGALVANRIAARVGVGRTILLSAVGFGPAGLLIPIAPREVAFPFLAASGFLMGLLGVVYNVNQVSLRQAITPERMLGQMNATMRFLVWGTIPVGSIVGGLLAMQIGTHAAIWVGSIAGVVSFVPIVFSPVPALQRMPEPVVEAAAIGVEGPAAEARPEAEVPPEAPRLHGAETDELAEAGAEPMVYPKRD